MFLDTDDYAFTAALARMWRPIYEEYCGVRDRVIDWIEPELYGEGWKVFGLFDFPHGRPLAESIALCPTTAALVDRHIPSHGAAGFSILKPGTRIKPHLGYQGDFLRFHLGLRVPPGDCGLRVGQDTRAWRDGEALVFDDRVEHEAWNLTEQERVILLVDFVPEAHTN